MQLPGGRAIQVCSVGVVRAQGPGLSGGPRREVGRGLGEGLSVQHRGVHLSPMGSRELRSTWSWNREPPAGMGL